VVYDCEPKVYVSPLQMAVFCEPTNIGYTVNVKVLLGPVQVLAVGVTVMVLVSGVEPMLVAANDGTFPTPLAPKPIMVLLLVHE